MMSGSVRYIIYTAVFLSMVWALVNDYMIRTSVAAQMVNLRAPSIETETWLNTSPMNSEKLKNKVYLVEFWTFGCYNCVNVESYVKKWYGKYKNQGFEVVSVHSPEFAHEKDINNVRKYISKKQINYPVAIDNDFAIWKLFNNRYWPAMYLVDKKGVIRYTHFGEGRYKTTEAMIKKLLAE